MLQESSDLCALPRTRSTKGGRYTLTSGAANSRCVQRARGGRARISRAHAGTMESSQQSKVGNLPRKAQVLVDMPDMGAGMGRAHAQRTSLTRAPHAPLQKSGVSGAFNLIPAGVLQRRRRYVAARFPQVCMPQQPAVSTHHREPAASPGEGRLAHVGSWRAQAAFHAHGAHCRLTSSSAAPSLCIDQPPPHPPLC